MSTRALKPTGGGCCVTSAAAPLLPPRGFTLFLGTAAILLPLAFVHVAATAQNRIVSPQEFGPGSRVVPDAHNCYPYEGRWSDRIDRALSGSVPVAIEQDLYWYKPSDGQPPRSLLAHSPPLSGNEPEMEHYFFDRVRPIVLAAIRNPDHSHWPLITLNLDIKTEEPEHLRAILALLRTHQPWLTTATKTASDASEALTVGPILVLNGPSDAQQKVFYDEVPVGEPIVTFGAVRLASTKPSDAPIKMEPTEATNYRRWWNNSWKVIENSGQAHAGLWTRESDKRLREFVSIAHRHHLWIRFYTLDGATDSELASNGWSKGYNFPSHEAVMARWRASIDAGVDYVASDQYAELNALVNTMHPRNLHKVVQLPQDR